MDLKLKHIVLPIINLTFMHSTVFLKVFNVCSEVMHGKLLVDKIS